MVHVYHMIHRGFKWYTAHSSRYTSGVSFLKNIQSKSSTTKAQYAIGIAALMTGIIAAFWMSTLSLSFPEVEPTVQKAAQPIETDQTLTDLFGDAQEQFGNVIDATKEGTELLNQVIDAVPDTEVLVDDSAVTAPLPTTSALGSIGERHATPETETESPLAEHEERATSASPIPEITSIETDSGAREIRIEVTNVPARTILIGTSTSSGI